VISAVVHGALLHACYRTDAVPGGLPDVVLIHADGQLVRSPELIKATGAWPWLGVVVSGEHLTSGFAALSGACALGWFYYGAARPGPAPRSPTGRPPGQRRSGARKLRITLQLALGGLGVYAFALLYAAFKVPDPWGIAVLLFVCAGFVLATIGGWFWLMHPDFDRPDGAATPGPDTGESALRTFRASARTRSALSRLVRAVAIALVVGLLIAFLGGAAILVADEKTNVGVVGVVMYLLSTQVVAVIAAVLALPLIVGWRHPATILLLRPFNRPDHSRPLRGLVRREVAGYGHVYSLADLSIKVRWYITIPVLLGQLGFMSFRLRRLRGASDVGRLVERQRHIRRRNVNWVVARSKVFAVRCVDEVWRQAVGELVRRSDAVLMDVTEVTDNMIWEIEVLIRQNRLEDCLFLALRGTEHHAAAAVSTLIRRSATVLAFDHVGRLVTPREFRSALAAVLFRTTMVDRHSGER
jgi:hypothetical protein